MVFQYWNVLEFWKFIYYGDVVKYNYIENVQSGNVRY